jgi:outer membrane protein assembly factor BamB
VIAASVILGHNSPAADWPMWRYDAGRTAASPHGLPDELSPIWTLRGTPRVQAWDDPLNLDLMSYDRLFEPIVIDGRMIIGYSDRDKVAAIDVETGEERWSFFTDAPVRLPPVGWAGKIYFTSDDGRLYCVDARTGVLRWQFHGGPGPRKVIGNRRLVSAWPARGGAVIRDGKVYFASSIWPFMGVFIYALDAETGQVQWVNDSSGATYIKQPHSAPSFAGVGPQGALVATENDLIVPGGRSVPAVYDRHTGQLRYFELNAGGKGTGGSFVIANDSVFFVHTRLKGVREFHLAKGDKTAFMPNEPVLDGDTVYTGETAKDGSPVVRAYDSGRKVIWEVAADASGDLILAGDKLYAAGADGVTAIAIEQAASDNTAAAQPRVVWRSKTDEPIERLLAAADKLFGVTPGGTIIAFGRVNDTPRQTLSTATTEIVATDEAIRRVERLLQSGDAEGYALWFGAADEAILDAIAVKTPFEQLAVVDGDTARVASLRDRFDAAGLYGKITAHLSTAPAFDAAPYIANMIFIGAETATDLVQDPKALNKVYQSVRPYGGIFYLLAEESDRQSIASLVTAANLEQAEVEITADGVAVRRVGALPGAADWTHQHGDIGNTRKSNDSRVKLPLGVLWFGGSSNMDVLPRHGHGPPQQVVDGRLFIQGMDMLSARDVYTGRVLWQRKFDNLGTHDVYYDATYKDTPLDTAYNQVHIPGSNARGTNFVVTPDRIYIVEGAVCRVLDPATGESIGDIELPQENRDDPQEWSYIGVYDDVLIGGLGFAKYRDRLGLSFEEEDGKLSGSKSGFGSKSLDRAGSLALVGFDRLTGRQLWRVDARHSFWNNAVVAGRGKIYCLDKNPKPVEDKLRRRGGALPDNYRILAIDAHTGETVWQVEEGITGTWLGYSESHDLLLQAGAAASDRLVVETDRGMTVYHGKDGSIKWSKPDLRYSGPCILHNDLIITNANSYSQSAGAFHLSSGEPYLITSPLTGEKVEWKITRAYGCNTIQASENLLTFRSGAAGFYDLTTHGGTGNFGGFKSGCTGNLIAAGGVTIPALAVVRTKTRRRSPWSTCPRSRPGPSTRLCKPTIWANGSIHWVSILPRPGIAAHPMASCGSKRRRRRRRFRR